MDPNELNETLENARNALRLLQEQIEENTKLLAQAHPSQQSADFKQQIETLNNLAKQLNPNIATIAANGNQNAQINPEPKEEDKTTTLELENQAREKVIQVPVRKRTCRSRGADPLNLGDSMAANTRTFALELPATPYHPPLATATEPPSTIIPPRHTPGLPANTPMAVQVLATLCARGVDVSMLYAGFDARQKNAVDRVPQQTRRQAAVRAAQAAPPRPTRPAASPAEGPAARRPCNCKRSQCLKLYCECFAASGLCMPGCACVNCMNTEADILAVYSAREAIAKKDPFAFDDKVTADVGHKKGCKCKRSKCLKKYCECFNAGVPCNETCKCEGCKNDAGAAAPAAPAHAVENIPAEMALAPSSLISPPGGMANTRMPLVSSLSVEDLQRAAAMAAMFSPVAFPSTAIIAPPSAARPAARTPGAIAPAAARSDAMAVALEPVPQAAPLVPDPVKKTAESGPVIDDSTPANALPRTSALTSHISDINATGVDVEYADTASSPAYGANQVRHIAAGTMTGGGRPGDARKPLAPMNTVNGPSTLCQDQDLRGKRPRRAASGGVVGAIAAATSDWGLDHTSPPNKRTNSMPDGVFDAHKGTALAARKERDMLLRKAIQNDAASNKENVVDEEDAISALVSMSSLG